MELTNNLNKINNRDELFINALKSGNNELCHQFFYQEMGGIIHKIRTELLRGLVDYDEMVNELYLYLSQNNWSKLNSFDAKNGCRLRTWMIPLAWRFFMGFQEKIAKTNTIVSNSDLYITSVSDDLRIQISIDVNAVLSRMPNQRYSEIIRLLIIEGYKAADVADMLNMRVENVYNLRHRAINQFIELYGQR